MPRVLVFDVNETLLDLAALDEPFRRAFGDAAARREWFAQLLQSALVATVTDAYDFGTIDADAHMAGLGYSSKLNPAWDFLLHLRDLGRERADRWIEADFARVGAESSLDIEAGFLDEDPSPAATGAGTRPVDAAA